MREIPLGPGDAFRIAVEEDSRGSRVLIRLGNGRWRPVSAEKARYMAELLNQAANEVVAARMVEVPVAVVSSTGDTNARSESPDDETV
jgi:hypothetical protein